MRPSPAFRKPALPLLLVLSSLAAAACTGAGGETLQYTDRDDIVEGPGLFSGEEGAFTLTVGDEDREGIQ